MQRKELTALRWLEDAKKHLTNTCFDPNRASICSYVALALYQQNPDLYPDFPLAKIYHLRAEASALNHMPILNMILDFYEALKYADGDEKNMINRSFRDALTPLEKSAIFSAIKSTDNPALEAALLRECIKQKTSLGAKMWCMTSGFWCSLERGTLKQICQRLNELDIQKVSRSSSEKPMTEKPKEAINFIQYVKLALSDIEKNKPEAAILRAQGLLDLYQGIEVKDNQFSPALLYYLRGYAHFENENLTLGIADIIYALETATEADHATFQLLFNNHLQKITKSNVTSMRKHFDILLLPNFKLTIFNALLKIPHPQVVEKLLEQCLDPTTALGAKMWHQEDQEPCTVEKGILKIIKEHLQNRTVSLSSSTLFAFTSEKTHSLASQIPRQGF